MSNNQIAQAIGVSDHTVKAIRDELGVSFANAKLKGKDGKHYPATMKREPRGEKDKDKGDDKGEPPPELALMLRLCFSRTPPRPAVDPVDGERMPRHITA